MSDVTVRVGPLLRSYTGGAGTVTAAGTTLGEALEDLERRYPGMRFRMIDEQGRIRRHMRIFVDGIDAPGLTAPLRAGGEIFIIGALSGG